MSTTDPSGVEPREISENDVAVVGISGRFPGAPDVDVLWERVRRGEDCLRDLSREELLAAGIPRATVDDPSYVRRTGALDGVDLFDAGFFGIGPRDAAVMDPQHRHFLECAWEALESAAVDPSRFDGAIGVFAGSGMNTYLVHCLLANPQLVDELGWFLLRHTGNDKDFLSTLVSYKLDLRGPSINVQTACSTSLVAVHLAVQSLLGMECDLALAGGVTIEVPHGVGYRYHEGEILSPTGRCRAFDAASDGTVLTSGAAVVALRRLTDAWEDGDPILAVIKGSAVNNDGARKVSYLAPSVDGHADVVTEALAVAGLAPTDVQLVDAHGTGTALGDPIEVAALSAAFDGGGRRGWCRLTSTKPNVGHLDTAAGAASLIKVVQALRHRTLPPMANHTAPSPLVDLDGSPFTLSGEASPWEVDGVRRAGVSSLGVGGTNAHVVVEEAPERRATARRARPEVLLLSARDDAALAASAARLADHLEGHPEADLGAVAHTLRAGRCAFPVRRAVGVADAADAVTRLRRVASGTVAQEGSPPRTVFLFPGGGSQHPGMGAGLDERFATFHRVREEVLAEVARHTDVDVRAGLAPDADPAHLDDPAVALPLVFATSLAMARQWMDLGVEPDAMLGHSLGEYVAAHLAGVLTLPDAVRLVVARSRLMSQVGGDRAAMLVVPLGEDDVADLLGPQVSLAVVNGPAECVLAGERDAVDAVAELLRGRDVETSRIPLAAAAHSVLLDPVLDEFREVARTVTFSEPTRPYVSNLTGSWVAPGEVTDPEHWVRHLRGTVRFADGLATVLGDGPTSTVELGPGHTLSATARRADHPPVLAVASMRHPRQAGDDTAAALEALGQRWALGLPVDLDALVATTPRVVLPTYPFQRQRHWIDPPDPSATPLVPAIGARTAAGPEVAEGPARIEDPTDMLWLEAWEPDPAAVEAVVRRWRVLAPTDELADLLVADLNAVAAEVRTHRDVDDLLRAPLADGDGVLLVGADRRDEADAAPFWLDAAVRLADHLGTAATSDHRLVLVGRGGLAVDGPAPAPWDALALGVARVAPREYPQVDTALVDVVVGDDPSAAVRAILDELRTPHVGRRVVAVRDGRPLTPRLASTTATGQVDGRLRDGGTYLVTGGLGGIGHTLARHLATAHGAILVLTTSRALPAGDARAEWLRTHGPSEPTSRRLRRIADLEATGARVEVVHADLADPAQVAAALDDAVARVGPLDGVVHAAGVLRDRLLATSTPDDATAVVAPKAGAAVHLVDELRRREVPLLLLVSSTSTVLAPAGQTAYVAANAVLDALAGTHGPLSVVTFASGMWAGTGMADEFARRAQLGLADGSPVEHPVFEELVAGRDGAIDVVGHLDPASQWILGEHRVEGHPVLPGTGHLELMVGAARISGASSTTVQLRTVALHEPLSVPDGDQVIVRVRVAAPGEGRREVRLESAPDGASWRLHSTAELVVDGAEVDTRRVEDPLAGVPRSVVDPLEGQRDHLGLGLHWSPPTEVARGADVLSGRVVAAVSEDRSPWVADPALLDAATGLAVQLVRQPGDDALFVPIGYRSVEWRGPVPREVEVVVRRTAGEPSACDVDVLGAGREPLVRIHGLELWRLEGERTLAASAVPDDVDARGGALAGLASSTGITPDEGVRLVELVLADGRPRLLASSVDLPALVAAADAPVATAVSPDVAGGADGGPTIERLAAMWAELLGVAPGPHDDFFDLGGHSLLAIRLVARLGRAFGVDMALTDVLAAPTLSEMAAFVDAHSKVPSTARSPIVPIAEGGAGTPLVIVHGAGGSVVFLWSLARALADERPVLGIQAVGVDGQEEPDPSIDAMADRYAAALQATLPGPYLLGGYSGGGLVALEVANRLRDLGAEVPRVVLFDSVPPGCASPRRRERVRNVLRHLAAGRVRGVAPYLTTLIRHGFRMPPVLDPDLDGSHVNLFDHFSAVAEQHRLGSYPVDVTLLKADQVWPIQPHDYYWTGHITGDLDVVSVPGDHFSMFSPGRVPQLAAEVRRALRGL
ncbi:type I polyketide synthase [Actinomarinicola tropica]|uniref:SDR family NAD(P)-dependent oxidoreductase n=1 Tax=Actinomarinicola tropica TaxID=2789776 RepID=A0A5Q2RGN0_9ACTN|nr:type I polyketide synthase [Actinomarinicola tropica]QGG95979.1 SDR family NAD(P)-dependent oxidoreductase [Actinomarinicola tropica]